MVKEFSRNANRLKRHLRQRQTIHGTSTRPRLTVYRSNTHIYAQVIDDENGVTLAQASSLDKDFNLENKKNKEAAKKVGELVAKRLQEKNIKNVIFDRSGYIYHGRVKEVAEGARSAGLEF
jgi:large subunit ribosomal protein L18